MLSNGNPDSTQQSKTSKHHRHHHRSYRSTPATATHDDATEGLNSNNHHQALDSTPATSSLPSLIQCSAYFLHRLDLADYTAFTLEETVYSVVTETNSKGLKVKISLPDEGLVIDNITDRNQSWIYKTSKLLYMWQDPYYLDIIVIITIKRSHYRLTGPYSASIFRLRGNESAQSFLYRAQQFFAKLPTSTLTKSTSKTSVDKSRATETVRGDSNEKKPKKQTRDHSKTKEQSTNKRSNSPQTSSNRVVARAEFDPGKKKVDSIYNLYNNRRTYSETTISSDTPATNSTKVNKTNTAKDDDKIEAVKTNLSNESVAELVRELKELRNEIASFKLDGRFTPVRSTSTSPLTIFTESSKKLMKLSPSRVLPSTSQAETNAETQTDVSLISQGPQKESSKNNKTPLNETNGTSGTSKRKNKRTLSNSSNNDGLDQRETKPTNSSQIHGSSNGITSSRQYQPIVSSTPSRPKSAINQNGFIPLNGSKISTSYSNEEDSFPHGTPVRIEKETSKVLSTNVPSSTSAKEIVSFRSSLDNTIDPPEHIYQNVPILLQMDPNQNLYYNSPVATGNDQSQANPYVFVTVGDGQNSEAQKQYLAQLFGQQNGISLIVPRQSIQPNSSSGTQEVTTTNLQPTLFANHLTNPLFTVDKQLLANTIANQFNVDLNSPYLQELIKNQHLFATHKRTFANMIWQMTPEEEKALCSSPITTTIDVIDTITVDSNSSSAKSILKAKRTSRPIPKRQRIRWDSALE